MRTAGPLLSPEKGNIAEYVDSCGWRPDYAVAIGLTLPACLTILDVISDLLADGCQIEELLLDKGIFGLFGKLPIHGRLLPKIVIPVHASSCLAKS
jgi:hypothetical protein